MLCSCCNVHIEQEVYQHCIVLLPFNLELFLTSIPLFRKNRLCEQFFLSRILINDSVGLLDCGCLEEIGIAAAGSTLL